MKLKDTFRITVAGSRTINAIAPVINANADALRELQELVLKLQTIIEELQNEQRSKG